MDIAIAIDLLEDIQTGEGTVFEVTPELADSAKFAIEKLEKQQWIPVEERLPGTERILITDGEIVKEGYRRPDGIWKYGVKEDELFSSLSSVPVIAWMPLPKPFNSQN